MHEIPYLNLRGVHDNIKEELDQAYREVNGLLAERRIADLSRSSQRIAGRKHVWELEMDWMQSA